MDYVVAVNRAPATVTAVLKIKCCPLALLSSRAAGTEFISGQDTRGGEWADNLLPLPRRKCWVVFGFLEPLLALLP